MRRSLSQVPMSDREKTSDHYIRLFYMIVLLLAMFYAAIAPTLAWAVSCGLADGYWAVTGSDAGSGSCAGSTLTITTQMPQGNDWQVAGYFDWQCQNGFGREKVVGTFSDNGHLVLDGIEIVPPFSNIFVAHYEANVTQDCRHMTNGTWGNVGIPTGQWQADRVGGVGVGAFVIGVHPQRVICKNVTTQKHVVIRDGEPTVDCAKAGLKVTMGDEITIRVDGVVQDNVEEPTIKFTSVPPYGSFANLEGQVSNIDPALYNIAVFIRVNGGWWTKPYWATPLTTIQANGSWSCDITTGGRDQFATEIVAYLVHVGYTPPLLSGGTLPAELDLHAVAKAHVTRQ